MNISTEGVSFENPSDNFMLVVPQTSRTIARARYNQYTRTPPKVEQDTIGNSFFQLQRPDISIIGSGSRQGKHEKDQEPVKPGYGERRVSLLDEVCGRLREAKC